MEWALLTVLGNTQIPLLKKATRSVQAVIHSEHWLFTEGLHQRQDLKVCPEEGFQDPRGQWMQ